MSAIKDNLGNPDALIERVRELTWALVDEQISSDEKALLESLLLSCDEARKTYIECMQLHADLAAHYAGQAIPLKTNPPSSPVLGFLQAGNLPMGFPASPISEPDP